MSTAAHKQSDSTTETSAPQNTVEPWPSRDKKEKEKKKERTTRTSKIEALAQTLYNKEVSIDGLSDDELSSLAVRDPQLVHLDKEKKKYYELCYDSMISWIKEHGSDQLKLALNSVRTPHGVTDDFRKEYFDKEYPAWNHSKWELCDSPEKFRWSREELPSVLVESWTEFKRRHAWRHASFVSYGDEYFALVRDPLLQCPVRCPFGSSRSALEDIVMPDATDILIPDTCENPESKDGSSEDSGVTRIASVEENLASLSPEDQHIQRGRASGDVAYSPNLTELSLDDLWRLTKNDEDDEDGEISEKDIDEVLHIHERTDYYAEMECEIRLKPKKAWALKYGSERLQILANSGMLKNSEAAFRDEYILREYPSWEYDPKDKCGEPRNPPVEVLQEWVIARKLVPAAILSYNTRQRVYYATATDALFRIPIRKRMGVPAQLDERTDLRQQQEGIYTVYRMFDRSGREILRVDCERAMSEGNRYECIMNNETIAVMEYGDHRVGSEMWRFRKVPSAHIRSVVSGLRDAIRAHAKYIANTTQSTTEPESESSKPTPLLSPPSAPAPQVLATSRALDGRDRSSVMQEVYDRETEACTSSGKSIAQMATDRLFSDKLSPQIGLGEECYP